MMNLRLPGVDSIPGRAGKGPIQPLLADAKDLSFGSTLNEQVIFTDQLIEWIGYNLPVELPHGCFDNKSTLTINKGDEFWIPLFDLAQFISSWINKLCLELQINDTQASKKEKTTLSCTTAKRQLTVIERILVHGLNAKHHMANAAVITCMWAPADQADVMQLLDSPGNGLMSCIDQLTAKGAYVDTFLSLKLQYQIILIMIRIIRIGNKDLLHSLCDCGLIRSISHFLDGSFEFVNDVPRLGQVGLFTKEYLNFSASIRYVWEAIIASKDEKIYENILALGLMQRLIEDWLPSTTSINIIVATEGSAPNPLFFRNEAIIMLKMVLINRPASERLVSEVVRLLHFSESVNKELAILKSISTKQGALNSRRTAAEVLFLIGYIGAESIDRELMEAGVPSKLLEVTRGSSIHSLAVVDAWIKWSQKVNNTVPKITMTQMEGFEMDDVFEDTDAPNITILDELEKHKEPPLAKSMIEKSVDKVWAERKDPKSKTTPNPKSITEEKIKDKVQDGPKKKKDVDIGKVIEDMGKHIITVKDLFDKYASESGLINLTSMTDLLLDLGLRGITLATAASFADEREIQLMDFPTFVEIYSNFYTPPITSTND